MTTVLKRRSRAARTSIAAVAALVAVALTVAACGGASGGSYGASAASGSAAAGSGGTSVALASSKLGKILVDSKGQTLYLFEADKGAASTCNGACARAWPPLTTTGKAAPAAGVSGVKLGTTKRGDGAAQVTYNGHPLYTFAGDGAPGQTAGQGVDGFGAEWYVVSGAGNRIEGGS